MTCTKDPSSAGGGRCSAPPALLPRNPVLIPAQRRRVPVPSSGGLQQRLPGDTRGKPGRADRRARAVCFGFFLYDHVVRGAPGTARALAGTFLSSRSRRTARAPSSQLFPVAAEQKRSARAARGAEFTRRGGKTTDRSPIYNFNGSARARWTALTVAACVNTFSSEVDVREAPCGS